MSSKDLIKLALLAPIKQEKIHLFLDHLFEYETFT